MRAGAGEGGGSLGVCSTHTHTHTHLHALNTEGAAAARQGKADEPAATNATERARAFN